MPIYYFIRLEFSKHLHLKNRYKVDFLNFFYCFQVQLSPFSPTSPLHPSYPHLPPLILLPFGFIHVSFTDAPENKLEMKSMSVEYAFLSI